MRVALSMLSAVLCLIAPLSVAAQTPSLIKKNGKVDYKALRKTCGGAPPFAVKFEGAKITGEASLTGEATQQLLAQVSGKLAELPVPDDLDLSAQAVVSKERVGVTFYSAFSQVGRSYFCMVKALYADDPAKQSAIVDARNFYSDLVLELSSPELYKDSTKKAKVIEAYRTRAKTLKVAFTDAEASSALGNYQFATVSKAQMEAVTKSGKLGSLSACGGVLKRSRADVDSRVLGGLDVLDSTMPQLLGGDGSLLVADIAGLGQALYEDGQAPPRLSTDDLLCVKKASGAIKDAIKDGATGKDQPKPAAKPAETEADKKKDTAPAADPKPAETV